MLTSTVSQFEGLVTLTQEFLPFVAVSLYSSGHVLHESFASKVKQLRFVDYNSHVLLFKK